MKIHIDQVALIGHTYNEYKQMFGFTREELKNKKIIDVGAGVSNFCGIANAFGLNVKAVDTIYDLPIMELEQRCNSDLAHVLNQLPKINNLYNWDYFGDLASLEISRIKSAQLFLKDYEYSPEHYVSGSARNLPFDAFSFDIAFVSHLMFLYDDLLDDNFHFDALKELMRVTKEEIIIFPLYNLSGEVSDFVQPIKSKLDELGVKYFEEESSYPVKEGKNKRLRIILNKEV